MRNFSKGAKIEWLDFGISFGSTPAYITINFAVWEIELEFVDRLVQLAKER
jgi:hypothetical protein